LIPLSSFINGSEKERKNERKQKNAACRLL
jgi:hypothetical protein